LSLRSSAKEEADVYTPGEAFAGLPLDG